MIDKMAGYLSAIAPYLAEQSPSLSWEGKMPASAARTLLCAIEVVEGAFGGFDQDPQQEVKLAILTPQCHVLIDPIETRDTTEIKLSGEDLGHFGAFMKRSWRANDWMWGRLDAVTFLTKVLGIDPDGSRELLTEVVKEEAPFICEAVQKDIDAGARSPRGRELIDAVGAGPDWDSIKATIRHEGPAITDREAARAFLRACRLGEERVKDEMFSPLLARVSTRSLAVGLAVLRNGGVPVAQKVVSGILAPLQGLSTTANRYVDAVRHDPPSLRRFVVAVATVAVFAGVAFADLLGVNVGIFGPVAWLGLLGSFAGLVLLAPVTSLIGAAFVASVGLFASLLRTRPSGLDWLPGGHGQRWLTLAQVGAGVVITGALWLMSIPIVGRVDRRLRGVVVRVLRGRDPTVDALETGLKD